MVTPIGRIEALFRYPVKSMRGEGLRTATLGWQGLTGDRRLAFRRVDNRGDFPWLSGGTLPELTWFTPFRREGEGEGPPTHVRTPDGRELELFGDELAAEVGRRHGAPVQMMAIKHGIYDEASLSVIATSTVTELCQRAGAAPDVRRFRPNVLVRTERAVPLEEDAWVGGTITFGDADDPPAIAVTMRDVRCAMVNIDPEGGPLLPAMMKACVQANDNTAGVYGTVIRTGPLAVGQVLRLHRG